MADDGKGEVMARPRTLQTSIPSLKRIVMHFRPYLRKERTLIAWSLAALLAELLLRLLEPWPLKLVLDRVIVSSPSGGRTGIGFLDRLDSMSFLTLCAIGVVLSTSLRAAVEYGHTVGFSLIGSRVLTRVRADVYNHLQRLPLSFHNTARGGDLLVRVTSDVNQLKEVTVTAALPLATSLVLLVGMFGLMTWINWQLTLLALAPLPLLGFRLVHIGRRLREAARLQRKREGAMAATAAESIGSMKAVHALSLEDSFSRAFVSQNEKGLLEGARTTKLAAGLERTVDVFSTVATALALWQGARLVLSGAITPGDLVLFISYLKNAVRPARDFAKYGTRLTKAAAAGERVLELLDLTPEVRDLPGARPAPPFQGVVCFDAVSFDYEPGRTGVSRIDFEARPGQLVALTGPSGAGKTTLTNLVMRLYDPTHGCVRIDGRDIREYTLESLRGQISVVLQDPFLFAATVGENIALGRPGASPEEIEAAARLAHADEFISNLPDGYDTLVGERGVTFSRGQCQRLSIARAAIRNAPIVILDEPTTGLDNASEGAVIDAIERLKRERTTLLITHDMRLAATADLILYLEGGRIIEQGTHAELIALDRRYAQQYAFEAGAGERDQPREDACAVAR
jgi:ATP-binding cassette, subfamily B, bacterial